LNLGNLNYNAGNFETAILKYQKALVYNAKSAVVYNNIGSAYNELGNYSEAIKYCEKSLQMDSTYSLAKNNLAIARERKK
jgi:tetratricopeptide (TPR) repeat protein